jgi:hypothetical protein
MAHDPKSMWAGQPRVEQRALAVGINLMTEQHKMRLASVLAIGLLAGCSSHYSPAELAGKYVLPIDGGVDTIELAASRTCVHSYRAKSGEMDHQDGEWTLEDLQAGPTVVLDNFRPLLAENLRLRRGPSFYHLLVEKSVFGNLYLIVDIDLDGGYKKQY